MSLNVFTMKFNREHSRTSLLLSFFQRLLMLSQTHLPNVRLRFQMEVKHLLPAILAVP
jgi:hypothetical protein